MKNIHPLNNIPLHKISEFWNELLKPENNIATTSEDEWKRKAEFMDQISMQNQVLVFLWNPFTNRFLYMSDKLKVLSGLEPSAYLAENGVEYSYSRLDPEHIDANLKLSQAAAAYFGQDNSCSNKEIITSFNYRYKNGNNEYVQVLQQIQAVELDANNQPTLFLSQIHYMGHIKRRDSAGAVVTTPHTVSIYRYNSEQNCVDPPRTFSEHERKIIKLLAQGYDTKTIAKTLAITEHTVTTHRRNLIKKTDCLDTTGVVAFARLINLI